MRAQLEAADAHVIEENEQACCYARSDKYWITDPSGIAWETFHTLSSTPHRMRIRRIGNFSRSGYERAATVASIALRTVGADDPSAHP